MFASPKPYFAIAIAPSFVMPRHEYLVSRLYRSADNNNHSRAKQNLLLTKHLPVSIPSIQWRSKQNQRELKTRFR